jgi:hypothetical protein
LATSRFHRLFVRLGVTGAALLLLGSVAVVAPITAAKGAAVSSQSATTSITVTLTGSAVQMPSAVPSGIVRFSVNNASRGFAEFQLLRLNPTTTLQELLNAAATNNFYAIAALVKFAGGVQIAGTHNDVYVKLVPATYVAINLSNNTFMPFTVSGDVNRGQVPGYDYQVTLQDYQILIPSTIRGHATLKLFSHGPSIHEFDIFRLAPGATVQDFINCLMTNCSNPPAIPVGGMAAINPGTTVWLPVSLKPGNYVVACFIPARDGIPHAALGMISGFSAA